MYELARLTPFVFSGRPCRVTDRKGNPWFVAKDVCDILEIIKSGRTFKDFSDDEKKWISIPRSTNQICDGYSNDGTSGRICDWYSNDGTSGKSRVRKTQKVLIINEAGVMRLILKSRKKNAWEFKERIIKLVSDYRKHGLNWAALPKIWHYRGKEQTHTEFINERYKTYKRLHPDSDFDEFLRISPF